jgi:hypothetical protein
MVNEQIQVMCNHVLHVNQHITVAMLDITVIFYVNKYTIL